VNRHRPGWRLGLIDLRVLSHASGVPVPAGVPTQSPAAATPAVPRSGAAFDASDVVLHHGQAAPARIHKIA